MDSVESLEQERALGRQQVDRFVDRFEPSYRRLAYYAALPLILTPELLNYLRNLLLKEVRVPWVAEVDFLLSDLCYPVGYEQYAMESAARAYLLSQMEQELGRQRIEEVARLLVSYVQQLRKTNPFLTPQEFRSQQWAAMVYLDDQREEAVRQIAGALQKAVGETPVVGDRLFADWAEAAQLTHITQELAPQMRGYEGLVNFANLVGRILADPTIRASVQANQTYSILPGLELKLPEAKAQTFDHYFAVVVGTVADNVAPIRATAEAEAIATILRRNYPHDQVFLLTGTEATLENILLTLNRVAGRTSSDSTFVFYFTGHSFILPEEDQIYFISYSKELMPFDSSKAKNYTLSATTLATSLKAISAREQLVILDTDHAGKMSSILTALLSEKSWTLLASSQSEESSYVISSLDNFGSFTSALLQGLQGRECSSRDGNIRVNDLTRYLVKQVPLLTNEKQHPYFHFNLASNFIVSNFLLTYGFDVAIITTVEGDTLPSSIELQPFIFTVATIDAILLDLINTEGPIAAVAQAIVRQRDTPLTDIERSLLIGTLQNQTYEQIAAQGHYETAGLKQAGRDLWQTLSWIFNQKVTKANVASVLDQWVWQQRLILREQRAGQQFVERVENQVLIRQATSQQSDVLVSPTPVVLEMVAIPGGSFEMGSPEEKLERAASPLPQGSPAESPQHTVTISPFLMGRYPVTQTQWRVIATLPQINRELNPDPSRFKGENRPVEQVSWYDAVEFCDRLSQLTGREYRLPTEAEWEYACRGGTTTPFHFGETITADLANYDGNYTYSTGPKGQYRAETTPVGSFAIANPFGLSDMHGNVWEWCLDHWHENYEGAPTDGSAWLTEEKNAYRLLRGGSWNGDPWYCRSAVRVRDRPDLRAYYIGFRLVCVSPWT